MTGRRDETCLIPYQPRSYGLHKRAAQGGVEGTAIWGSAIETVSRSKLYCETKAWRDPALHALSEPSQLHVQQLLWKRPPTALPLRGMLFERDMSRWSTAIAVLGASGGVDAATQIDAIRERAEDLCISAESHLRALIKALPPLNFTNDVPSWFKLSELESARIDPRAISSARELVRATVAMTDAKFEATCEPGRDGAIEISWETPSQLTWVVGRPRMSWPGVNVRAYVRADESTHALQTRSFFLAHRVVIHAVGSLRHES
jgi:hypothetical protein